MVFALSGISGAKIKILEKDRANTFYTFHKITQYQNNEYNLVSATLSTSPNTLFNNLKTSPYIINSDEWNASIYNCVPVTSNQLGKTLLKGLSLIGDRTTQNITIPEGNTTILSYTLGEGINGEFVEKPLQYNVPCEYTNGVMSSRTWFTFNSYTSTEWQNGFHFQGDQ